MNRCCQTFDWYCIFIISPEQQNKEYYSEFQGLQYEANLKVIKMHYKYAIRIEL